MNNKRLIVLFVSLVIMVFTPVVVGMSILAHAQEMTQEIKGTVSRIDGNKLTIRDDMNMEKTVNVEGKDLESLKQIKVGDRVLVRDGKVTKGGTQ